MSSGMPGSWKRQEGLSTGASGEGTALGHLDLRRLVSETERGQTSVVRSICPRKLTQLVVSSCPDLKAPSH